MGGPVVPPLELPPLEVAPPLELPLLLEPPPELLPPLEVPPLLELPELVLPTELVDPRLVFPVELLPRLELAERVVLVPLPPEVAPALPAGMQMLFTQLQPLPQPSDSLQVRPV
jgi:hypothetical protein